jgi:DNA-binding transcriptional MerR regulator
MTNQFRGISGAAREVPCAEGTLRALERRGVIQPIRDSAGRRLFSDANISAARAHLGRRVEGVAA